MNFKKFISGVSALTIAASAFAGMAVTASAADPIEKDYLGTSTAPETFDDFDGTGVTSTAGTFSGTASGNNYFGIVNYTEIAKPEVGSAYDSTLGYPTYVSGNALDTQVRGKTAATTTLATFNQNVGKLYFEADLYSHATYTQLGPSIVFYNAAGEKIAYANVDYADSAYIRSYNATATQLDRTYDSMTFRNSNKPGIGYHIGVVMDIDNDAITLTGDLINTTGVRSNRMNSGAAKTCTISDIAKVTLEFTGNASSNNFGVALDNVQIYGEVPPEAAGAVTVKYVAGETELDSASPSVDGLYVSDTLNYYYPAYIQKNGKVYRASTSTYDGSVVLTAAAQDVPVNYTALDGVVQYAECTDSTAPYGIEANTVSNGKVYSIGSGTFTAMTVAEDGVYSITASAVRVNNDSFRTGNILVNDQSVGTVNYDNTPNDTVTGVPLHEGDIISVTGNNSKSGLDYVLIQKTGDLAEASDVTADATFTTDDGDPVKTFRFTVTTNDETVRSITVKADGATGETSQTLTTPVITDGVFNCAIIAKYTSTAPAASAFHVSIN